MGSLKYGNSHHKTYHRTGDDPFNLLSFSIMFKVSYKKKFKVEMDQ